MEGDRSQRTMMTAVLITIAYPSLLTWAYFVLLAGNSATVQQIVYGVGKCLQFGLPIVLVWRFAASGGQRSTPRKEGLVWGVAFGAAVAAAMAVLYLAWLRHVPLLDQLQTMVWQKVSDLGLQSIPKYAAVGLFYSICHSFLEEYYWRWFVFGQLRRIVRWPHALLISSVGFAAHHVILLATFFGWSSPWCYVFSLAVGLGGAFWAWLYQQSDSLRGPWISHAVVDAAIFSLGYVLIHDLML